MYETPCNTILDIIARDYEFNGALYYSIIVLIYIILCANLLLYYLHHKQWSATNQRLPTEVLLLVTRVLSNKEKPMKLAVTAVLHYLVRLI